jgi:hypothetical protein
MSIVVSPEVERALAERAQSEGTTPDLLADSYLSERLFPSGSKVPAQPRNLAEYLADHIGVLSSVKDGASTGDLSEGTGEQYRRILLEREAQRRG